MTPTQKRSGNPAIATQALLAVGLLLPTLASAAADFVIQKIELSANPASTDAAFSALVTVKNQGGSAGDAGQLVLWKHKPLAQPCDTPGDAAVALGRIAAGATKTVRVKGLRMRREGDWKLRAFVDGTCLTREAAEGNNQRVKSYTVNDTHTVNVTDLGNGMATFGSGVMGVLSSNAANTVAAWTQAVVPPATGGPAHLLASHRTEAGMSQGERISASNNGVFYQDFRYIWNLTFDSDVFPSGDAVVVENEVIPGAWAPQSYLAARFFDAGDKTWGAESILYQQASGTDIVFRPQVVAWNEDGVQKALATWFVGVNGTLGSGPTPKTALRYSHFDGTAWSPQTSVATFCEGCAEFGFRSQKLARDNNGNVWLVATANTGTPGNEDNLAYAVNFSNGQWSTPQEISVDANQAHYDMPCSEDGGMKENLAFAMSPGGKGAALIHFPMCTSAGVENPLFVARYDGKAWLPLEQVDSAFTYGGTVYRVKSVETANVATNDAGDALIYYNGDTFSAALQFYDNASATWQPTVLTTGNLATLRANGYTDQLGVALNGKKGLVTRSAEADGLLHYRTYDIAKRALQGTEESTLDPDGSSVNSMVSNTQAVLDNLNHAKILAIALTGDSSASQTARAYLVELSVP